MTAALEGGEWSAARTGRALPPGKTRYPFYRRLGGSQDRSGRAENLVPTGIRSRTVRPVVSRYTDLATGPTRCQWVPNIISRQRLEVHHSRLTNIDVKNKWRFTSNCLICLHSVHTDSFIVTSCNHISDRLNSFTAVAWIQLCYSTYCSS